MSDQTEAMKTGIMQIMAGAKRVDPGREMPADEVWKRQARQLIEQRSASLLAALSEQELLAVATGQISLAELWKAS
jgi:hypothetical protein